MAKTGSTSGSNTQTPPDGVPAAVPRERRTPPGQALHSPAIPSASRPAKPLRLNTMDQVVSWLMDRTNVENLSPARLAADTLKLERMFELCRLLGNPEQSFRSVHVAGTKGKGSTCEMTAGMLEGCGLTVGVYTSPHLVDIRERIRINRALMPVPDFIRVAQRLAEAASRLPESIGEPTYFELMTAMAFVYFAELAVDIAMIEVGLGGRLDSTNVITPEVCAITSISYDHWQILGNTLELIAGEKAGIFKPGVQALTCAQKPSVIEVFKAAAQRVGCPLSIVGTDLDFSIRFEARPAGSSGQNVGSAAPMYSAGGSQIRVGLTTPRNSFEHLQVPLRGEHQALNCGLALAIVDALTSRGIKAPEARVAQGLATVTMPGRMELIKAVIRGLPARVLLDGAHNADSMKCLMKSVGSHVPYDSMIVIFGCASDKDIPGMLKELAVGADKVIFTRTAGSSRAANPEDLVSRFQEEHEKMAQVASTLEEALSLATKGVGREDLICITGSLHLVGQAKSLLQPTR